MKQTALAAGGFSLGAFSGCLGLLGEGDSPDDAWPMFHHDAAHSGYNPAATSPESPVEEKWSVDEFPGPALTATVVDDTVYLRSFSKAPATDTDLLRAYSTEDGSVRWTFDEPEGPVRPIAVVDGTIYVPREDGIVSALDLDGTERWTFEGATTPGPVTVTDGTLYVPDIKPASGSGTVYAVDADGGDEQWCYEGFSESIREVSVADGTLYIRTMSDSPTLHAVDADSQTEAWRFEGTEGPVAVPMISNDTVYLGCGDTNVYALDAASGEERWRFDEISEPFGMTAVDDDTLYASSYEEGRLYALDATSGERRWHADGPKAIPLVGGDTVYISGPGPVLYALDTESGEERWRFEGNDDPFFSEPTPVGDTVYVGTVGGAYALH